LRRGRGAGTKFGPRRFPHVPVMDLKRAGSYTPRMKTIAILTSGGDAAGMNAAIRAVTRSALDRNITVFGVRQGYQGLIENQMIPLGAREVGGIIQIGGTFLGRARSKEFREQGGQSKALRSLASRGIDGLVVIGGNGSQTGSHVLSKLGFP